MRYVKLLMLGFTFLMLTSATPAKKHKCPPPCHRCAEPAKPAVETPELYDQVLEGLELNAGFRWETVNESPDVLCPTAYRRNPHYPTVKDPFYLGVGLRLALAPKVGVFGNFDRDFTDAPHWQTRVGLVVTPFAKR